MVGQAEGLCSQGPRAGNSIDVFPRAFSGTGEGVYLYTSCHLFSGQGTPSPLLPPTARTSR